MDYEKMYKNALSHAKQAYGTGAYDDSTLEAIFPELAESEDEEIRKEIIGALMWQRDCLDAKGPHDNKLILPGFTMKVGDILEWLEKQKEQKPNIELIQRSWYMEGYHDREFGKEPKWVIKTGEGGPKHELNPRYGQPLTEQHPSSKFLPGDWAVYDGPLGHAILQVKDVLEGRYTFVDNDSSLLVEDSDKFLRPLTPKDVEKKEEWKPQPDSLEALMYAIEGKWDAISPTSYLSRRLEDLYEGLVNTYNVDETLLAELPKAASCAYTAEDIEELRELKRKIEASMEQKPVEPSDDELQRHQDELYDFKVFAAKQAREHHISFVHDFEWNNFCAELLSYFNEKQKPAEWSEEDADILNCCISSIEEAKENRYAYKETDGDTSYDREIDWLKSLRPSWKPSEEQPEVDLEEEVKRYYSDNFAYISSDQTTLSILTNIARHFAEWGAGHLKR